MARSEFDLDWNRVSNALSALLRRNGGLHRPSVIFEDRETERFVQFATSREGGLLLDLPSNPLDDEAMARAKQYFSLLGVELRTGQLYEDIQGTRPSSVVQFFQLDLAHDVQRATRIVFDVFDHIYRLPQQLTLIITEH